MTGMRMTEYGNRVVTTTSERPKGWPQLLNALERLGEEHKLDPSLEPELAKAAVLLERVNGVEFYVDDWAPGQETAFILVDAETRSADLIIPDDPSEQVVSRATGRELGRFRDIEALGAWLWTELNRSHYAHLARHAVKLQHGNRQQRRAENRQNHA
ncbi:hypothetical protein GCM10007989_02110 [Devosia pacifica]|uniref:Uncharacterized protein n=2 Tax=Devosia pacifica TaxID=1335967 RepID=A0A918VNW6_9HYPH|nr:hypothetical protein GCM10007989_02110 [Devosia pacifica]